MGALLIYKGKCGFIINAECNHALPLVAQELFDIRQLHPHFYHTLSTPGVNEGSDHLAWLGSMRTTGH